MRCLGKGWKSSTLTISYYCDYLSAISLCKHFHIYVITTLFRHDICYPLGNSHIFKIRLNFYKVPQCYHGLVKRSQLISPAHGGRCCLMLQASAALVRCCIVSFTIESVTFHPYPAHSTVCTDFQDWEMVWGVSPIYLKRTRKK